MTLGYRSGVGQFFAWDGGCLFIGRHDSVIPVHAHYAIQLVIGSSAEFRVRTVEGGPWRTYTAALIPSRHPHGLDVTSSEYGAIIFVEPETREGRAIAERFLHDGIAEVVSDSLLSATRALFDAWLEQREADIAIDRARAMIQVLAQGVQPSVVTDSRILGAIAYITDHLTDQITLGAVASHAFLSPSRFRHLFVEQTGMALRPYILWRRFLRVWDLLMKGASLSTAAHAAGFADSAHLSRTSRRTFGFAPSGIQVTAAPPAPATATRHSE